MDGSVNVIFSVCEMAAEFYTSLTDWVSMPAVLVTGSTVYCYTELTVFFRMAMAVITVASTHFAYPLRDAQTELVRVASSNTKTIYSIPAGADLGFYKGGCPIHLSGHSGHPFPGSATVQ